MGASAAFLFPYFGEAAAAAGTEAVAAAGTEAVAAAGTGALETAALTNSFVDPALFAAGSAAVDPAILGSIGAGTFEFAPMAADAAGAGLSALTGTAADYVGSGLGQAVADAGLGSSVGTSAAAQGLTGTAADFSGLSGGGSALTPLVGGGGTVASTLAPSVEAASSVLPVTQLTEEELAAQGGAAFTTAPQAASQVAQVGAETAASPLASASSPLASAADPSVTSVLQPTLTDASSSASQTLGGQPGQEISKDLSKLASSSGPAVTDAAPAVTDNAVVQASATATPAATAPAATATPAATAPAATAPAATAPVATPTVDALAPSGGTSALAKGAGDAAGSGFNVGSFLKDYGSLALGGAGLAYNMLKGNQKPEYQATVEAAAQQMAAQSRQLQGYLTSGTLPPGMGAALSSAHNSAEAAIRSRYANMGMSGSSAEMNDLANLSYTTVSQGATIASQLLQTGVNEAQFASGLYQNLMATSMAQDTAMSNAIAGFTNAMAGGFSRKPNPVG